MRFGISSLVIVTVAACATTLPKNQIAAYGLAGGTNHALARTTAQNRAVANLQRMMALDAVSFSYRVAGTDSAVELKSVTEKGSFESTEFIPLAKGWASKATGLRPQAVADAMAGMTFVAATGEAHRDDPGLAMLVAEARAIRALLAPLAADCAAAGCKLTGTISIRDATPEFLEDGVRLTINAAAKVTTKEPATPPDRAAAHTAIASEYGQESQWEKALAALDQALVDGQSDAKLFAMRGTMLTNRGPERPTTVAPPATPPAAGAEADDPSKPAKIANLKEIVAAFSRAAELDGENRGYKDQLAKATAALAVLEPPAPAPAVTPPGTTKPPVKAEKKKSGKLPPK